MRAGIIVLVCVAVLLAVCDAEKRHRRKHKKPVEEEKPKDELDLIADDAAHDSKKSSVKINEIPDEVESAPVEEPCANVHCGPGKECHVTPKKKGECRCVSKCTEEVDARRKVCSNHNETWDNDCQVYRMRCLCSESSEECTKSKYSHIHVDYYGACREISECTEDEMNDFPRRMREWLFNVMQDLAQRHELNEGFLRLEKEAEKSQGRKWVNAVIWKFCDLDSHPHDRAVSRHELFPIRAPLLVMEHCIAPFLDGCDSNDDHIISLVEWGKCLGLEENEIEDKCVEIRNNRNG